MGTKVETVLFILKLGTWGHWRQRCTRGAREGHKRGKRGALIGIKVEAVLFILKLGTLAPKVHKRCTRGAREAHHKCKQQS